MAWIDDNVDFDPDSLKNSVIGIQAKLDFFSAIASGLFLYGLFA